MKKLFFLILLGVGLMSCENKSYNKITIEPRDSVKVVQIEVITVDTFITTVDKSIPDSLILIQTKILADSIRKDNSRRDSLHKINFRKVTKIINGGYNGLSDRERLWERAKEVLN